MYINQIDKGSAEYKNILISEMIPILNMIPSNLFENLRENEKIKYELLFNKQTEQLCYITCKERENRKLERENRKLERENRKLKEQIKIVKSTKGWFNYKIMNIYSRVK